MSNEGSISLRDRLSNGALCPTDVMDVALLLGRWLADDEYSEHREEFEALSPDSIVFDDQNMPRVIRKNNSTMGKDLIYHSPQYAAGQVQSCVAEDWFSLGLIIYHMMTGKTLYQSLPRGIFASAEIIVQAIQRGRYPGYDRQIISAICKLCDPNSLERRNGFETLVEYVLNSILGYVEIVGECDGQSIRLPDYQFDINESLEYRLPERCKVNGVTYATESPVFSYRPGRHLYHITLRQANNDEGNHNTSYEGRWLLTNAQNGKWSRLICLDNPQSCQYDIPIELTAQGCVVVLTETISGENNILYRWQVAQASGAALGHRGILRFSRSAGSDTVTLSLFNSEKNRRLTNDLTINMRQY